MIRFMNSPKLFLLLCLIILLGKGLTDYPCSSTTYAQDSTFQTNLNILLSSLSSNADRSDGVYNTSVVDSNTPIYGRLQCLRDATVQACQKCVSDGINDLLRRCPNNTGAVDWYDNCWLRFSDQNFFSEMEEDPMTILFNTGDATNTTSFMNLLGETLQVIAKEASEGGSKKFATKTVEYNAFQTLYTMAQCTSDISETDCYNCLRNSISNLPNCCNGKVGGVTLKPSCYLRYETYVFYREAPPPPAKDKSRISARIIIAIAVPTVIFILLVSLCLLYLKRRVRKYSSVPKQTDNKLGQGGFGEVYKGILPNGQELAVKRLLRSSKEGVEGFKNEVLMIAKLQHRNLVKLLGFCLDEEEKMIIYEYLPNKSLDNFLFGSQRPRVLNWPERYKIIDGVARGIHYLHEYSRDKVIHRDLKPSNILLDEEMNPKISDFGMARMVGINETRRNTDRIAGTIGYMSPEYFKYGSFSDKSDVFSFGVIVLEIISGKRITSQYDGGLSNEAWKHWKDGELTAILDSNMTEAVSHSKIMRCIHIGLLCIEENPQIRPAMEKVVQYLSNDSIQLPIPQEPAFFMHSQMELAATNRATMEVQLANHNQYSINEISESELFPR